MKVYIIRTSKPGNIYAWGERFWSLLIAWMTVGIER